MPKLIISYRRADSDAIAGRIRDRLAHNYGEGSVYMDIDSIPFGTDFRDHIRDALFDCDILLVVVGPAWLGPIKGRRLRISEENDPVRIEVEAAIERGIPLIPVLVSGAQMPKPSELPPSLTNFAYRNAAEVDSGRDFHAHMDRLVRSMDRLLQSSKKSTVVENPGFAPPSDQRLPASEPEQAKPAPIGEQAQFRTTEPAQAQNIGALASAQTAISKRAAWLFALGVGAVALVGLVIWLTLPKTVPPQVAEQAAPPAPVAPSPTLPAPPQPSPVQTPSPEAPPASTARGCDSGPSAFYDNFKTPDAHWDTKANEAFYSPNGGFMLTPPADKSFSNIYRPLIYKNAIICIDVHMPSESGDNATGGLIFWAEDYDNYFLAQVTSNGQYRISRRFDGNWRTIVSNTKLQSIKQGYGVLNRIKVITAGNIATVYFNDVKALDLKGQPSKRGTSFGFYAQSAVDRVTEWRHLNIAVVETEQPAASALSESTRAMLSKCKFGSSVSFSDDFKTNDPAWNLSADLIYYLAGQLAIKPLLNKTRAAVYSGLVYKNIDICAEVQSPSDGNIESNSWGGIIFWAQDYNNYYTVEVHPNGEYAVYRLADNKWIPVISPKNSPVVNKGPGAQNRLKVFLKKDSAQFYINDTKVSEIRGQPPAEGSSVGLAAGSPPEYRAEWRFNGIVVVETP